MRYECSIAEKDGVPDFKVNIVEIGREFKGTKPTLAWTQILKTISTMRDKSTMEVLRFFPSQISKLIKKRTYSTNSSFRRRSAIWICR
jgi:hypothetical protein